MTECESWAACRSGRMGEDMAKLEHITGLAIASVEYETGIGKDRLRAWERRYGFPAPQRDRNGKRVYPPDQVARLKIIKRLIDIGHAPNKLLTSSSSDLETLLLGSRGAPRSDADVQKALDALRDGDLHTFDSWLRTSLLREGLEGFLLGPGRAILEEVGQAWQTGCIAIWHEHYFSEQYSALLRSAIASLPAFGRPKILLATPAGERHGLGLLMTQALFAVRGAECISLGVEIPNADIVSCASQCKVDVVALSISTGFSIPRAKDVLTHLRANLPPATQIWIGGAGAEILGRALSARSFQFFSSLEEGLSALQAWRQGPHAVA
jgi:MerR family transcriptional regulator, light-induced transcriptional regulator